MAKNLARAKLSNENSITQKIEYQNNSDFKKLSQIETEEDIIREIHKIINGRIFSVNRIKANRKK